MATVDLGDVRSRRANFIARSFQASSAPRVARIEVDFRLAHPEPLALCPSVPHAPRRPVELSRADRIQALTNVLRYFPKEQHAALLPELAEELRTLGHIYCHRLRPVAYAMRAYPISEYPARCRQAARRRAPAWIIEAALSSNRLRARTCSPRSAACSLSALATASHSCMRATRPLSIA